MSATVIHMQKTPQGVLMPTDEDAQDYLRKLKVGQDVTVNIKRSRNLLFHRKWFALARLAFDFWEPKAGPDDPEKKWMKHVVPAKNFDRFRKDLTILAGFYDASYRINGEVRIEAKSLAFGRMSEDEFEELYSKTIDAVLKHVMTNIDEAELRRSVEDMVLAFV